MFKSDRLHTPIQIINEVTVYREGKYGKSLQIVHFSYSVSKGRTIRVSEQIRKTRNFSENVAKFLKN